MLEDSFTTKSGRAVALRIYTQPQSISEVGFAMESLKKSMKWDEDVYGLEYDLVRWFVCVCVVSCCVCFVWVCCCATVCADFFRLHHHQNTTRT